MRCLDCRYNLKHLTEHRCPECGRAFDPKDAGTVLPTMRTVDPVPHLLQIAVSFIVILCAVSVLNSFFPSTPPPDSFIERVYEAVGASFGTTVILVLFVIAGFMWGRFTSR